MTQPDTVWAHLKRSYLLQLHHSQLSLAYLQIRKGTKAFYFCVKLLFVGYSAPFVVINIYNKQILEISQWNNSSYLTREKDQDQHLTDAILKCI